MSSSDCEVRTTTLMSDCFFYHINYHKTRIILAVKLGLSFFFIALYKQLNALYMKKIE